MRRRPRVIYVVERCLGYDGWENGAVFSTRCRAERYLAALARVAPATVTRDGRVFVSEDDAREIVEYQLDRKGAHRHGCYESTLYFNDAERVVPPQLAVFWAADASPEATHAWRESVRRPGDDGVWYIVVRARAHARAQAAQAVRALATAIMEGTVTVPIPDGADAQ